MCPHCFKDIRFYLDSVFENPEYIGTKIEIVETIYFEKISWYKNGNLNAHVENVWENLFNSNNVMFECLS